MNFKQQYFNIWGEAYQLHKQFAGRVDADEEWRDLLDTSEKIMKEHEKEPQSDFMRSLLLAEIERNCKSRRKEGATDGTHGKLELVCKGNTGEAKGQT